MRPNRDTNNRPQAAVQQQSRPALIVASTLFVTTMLILQVLLNQ